MMRVIIVFLVLILAPFSAISEEQKACYMIFKSWDFPTTPSLAAGKIANEIDETCKVGDHLFIEPVNRFALAQLVTHICNPKFEIIFHPISDNYVAVSCVNSGNKRARQG
jgi:hypothetical protein